LDSRRSDQAIETGLERWQTKLSVRLLVLYAVLIAAIYPAFFFFTRLIPGEHDDSLGLRVASAALSGMLAAVVLIVPGARPFAPRLQLASIGFFFLTLFAILVDTNFNVWYLAGDLLGVFGAQYAFVRRRGLLLAYGFGCAYLVAFATARGTIENPLAIYSILVIVSGASVAVASGWFRIVTQRAEVRNLLQLERQTIALRAQGERIEHLAYFDALTDLPNRASMNERIEEALAASARHDRSGALLYLDLDGFKEINDAFGHDAGDRVLAQAAVRLGQILRKDECAARIGGDEFAILLPAVAGVEEASDLARRIQGSFGDPFVINRRAFSLSASIGIARFPQDATTRDGLLACADAAMYSAKRRGRGCVYAYAYLRA
jgi:diguanylate cyclase (GGDEF)-like protein